MEAEGIHVGALASVSLSKETRMKPEFVANEVIIGNLQGAYGTNPCVDPDGSRVDFDRDKKEVRITDVNGISKAYTVELVEKKDAVPRQYSMVRLVAWYADLSRKHTKKGHTNPMLEEERFIYLGEIPNMSGHCITIGHKTGKPYSGYHVENFEEIPEEEV